MKTELQGMSYHKQIRYTKTLDFLLSVAPLPCKILDLGTPNDFSKIMQDKGYEVENTKGEDLDIDYKSINTYQADLVTSFELFEHLFAPYNVLKEMKANRLIASVPLNNWFAKAYWNDKVEWDRHYHEFEKKQFDWLLEKTGWKVRKYAFFTSPVRALGIRPILRLFTPRIYIVYCERI
jgi:hypothetical protein